jgi:hypothetical protein
MPIDLRKPNPSYDDRTIDTLSTYLCCSIRPADINSNITLERLPTTFQWETGSLSYQHISKALTRYEIGQQADNHRLERLLIEASVTPSLLCPIDGYQHPR